MEGSKELRKSRTNVATDPKYINYTVFLTKLSKKRTQLALLTLHARRAAHKATRFFIHEFQKKKAQKNAFFLSFLTKIFKILSEIVSILYVLSQKSDEKSVFEHKNSRNH